LCVQDLGYDQPTVLLSNDSQAAVKLITRYAQRMLVEKAISDAARFFHLPLSIFPFPIRWLFLRRGRFRVAPRFPLKDLESPFRHKVLRMLLVRGKITEEFIRMTDGWKHSGFNVYCGLEKPST
jgi:hypothetical protein